MTRTADRSRRGRWISRDSVVAAAKDQVSCDLDGEIAILNLRNGVYYGLEGVGTEIWKMVERPVSAGAIVRAILETYDVDEERCEEDVLALLDRLAEERLIEVDDGHSR